MKRIELVLSRKIVKIMTGMILMGILLLYQWIVSPIDQFNIGPGVNGPCAISSFHKILKYWQRDVPVAELISLANDQYNLLKRWTSAKYQLGRLSLLAEKYNLSCLYCRGDQNDIEKLCKLGIPVLIHTFLADTSHMSVMTGIREAPKHYTFADSFTSDYRVFAEKDFARIWNFQNNEYVVIAPQNKIPEWVVEDAGFAAKVNACLLYSQWQDKVYQKSLQNLLSELEGLREPSRGHSSDLYYWIISCYIAELEEKNHEFVIALQNVVRIKPDYEMFADFLDNALKKAENRPD